MSALFEITTPLGCTIHTTKDYWQYLIEKKHPILINKESLIIGVLQYPDEVRVSQLDPLVHLYYRRVERLYCVVAKHQSHTSGFLITAYPVDKVKEGPVIWTKSSSITTEKVTP
jgi:hypothetical protein